jgi:hypothetical protein
LNPRKRLGNGDFEARTPKRSFIDAGEPIFMDAPGGVSREEGIG